MKATHMLNGVPVHLRTELKSTFLVVWYPENPERAFTSYVPKELISTATLLKRPPVSNHWYDRDDPTVDRTNISNILVTDTHKETIMRVSGSVPVGRYFDKDFYEKKHYWMVPAWN